jgi:GT2 family glycosyltransferase
MDIFESLQQQKQCDGNYSPKVAVVVVHTENLDNTIQCIESLLSSNYPNKVIVICDNSSDVSLSDQLVERIIAVTNCGINILAKTELCQSNDVSIGGINIIRCGQNLGYAAAANLGFMLTLKDVSTKYAWLLNDDVAVESSCLTHMISRSEAVPNAGICGSRCVYYHNPHRIQALGGGKFFRWSGRSALIGNMSQADAVVNQSHIEQELDFVFGASMLVSRPFLEEVGLMSEEYFIYCEEPDWAMRGRAKWAFLYSHDAVVFHKGGATIGTGTSLATTNPTAEFYMLRSRLIFTRKFFPASLVSVWLFNVLRAMRALALGYPSITFALLTALAGFRYKGSALPGRPQIE